jgi:hypothetical protein
MRCLRVLRVGLFGLCCGLLGAAAVLGQASAGATSLSGEWELTTLIFGVPLGERLILKVERGKVSGSVRHQGKSVPITGTVNGDAIRFEYKGDDGSQNVYEGRAQDAGLAGRSTSTGGESWGEHPSSDWRARRPRRIERPSAPRWTSGRPASRASSPRPCLPSYASGRATPCAPRRGRREVDGRAKARVLGGNPRPALPRRGRNAGRRARGARAEAADQPWHRISDDGLVDRAVTDDYAADHKDDG